MPDSPRMKKTNGEGTTVFLFVSQEHLDESQIDAGFKSLFRQLAGPVSAFLAGSREKNHVGVHSSAPVCANRTWRSASQSCRPY